MPINNITQTISKIPPAGARGVDVQTLFVIKQEDFQDHLQGTTVAELNTLKDQLNSRIGEINSTATTMNGYATSASSSASTATTKAGEASTSASQALTYKNQASTSATEAATSAASLTPSGILTAIKTVDGSGSGLDADLLDGRPSNEFMYQQDFGNNVNLNTLFQSGSYHIGTANPNSPSGSDYGNVLVVRGNADTVAQLFMSPDSSNIYWRGGSGSGSIWQPWRRILSDGNSLTTAPLGYASGIGVGGVVVQDTNKSTAVTLNKLTGRIVMNNSSLANGATVIFTVTNSRVANTDLIYVSSYGFGYNYRVEMHWITDGQFQISVTNKSGATLSEVLSINFAIFKGAIS